MEAFVEGLRLIAIVAAGALLDRGSPSRFVEAAVVVVELDFDAMIEETNVDVEEEVEEEEVEVVEEEVVAVEVETEEADLRPVDPDCTTEGMCLRHVRLDHTHTHTHTHARARNFLTHSLTHYQQGHRPIAAAMEIERYKSGSQCPDLQSHEERNEQKINKIN